MAAAHVEVAQALAGVQIVGVASRTARSAERLATLCRSSPFTNWHEMLDVARCDALVVAVSHEVAPALYAEVVERGIPVLLEKPAGVDAASTAALAERAAVAGTTVMVAVNRRFYSTLRQARMELLRHGPINGVLAEVHEPIYRYRSRGELRAEVYDDWLVQNSIHVLDLLTLLGGEATIDFADVQRRREVGPDHLVAELSLGDGIRATILGHFNSGGGVGIRVYGEGVTASLVPLERATLSYATGRRIVLEPDDVDRRFKPGLYAQMAWFVGAVRDDATPRPPASDLADHGRTMALLDGLRSRVSTR